jgi:hypothetical protein
LTVERKTADRTRHSSWFRLGYPWAITPTINTTKPVATAMATFVSTDKFIIFPSIMAATHVAPVFLIFLSQIASNFSALMDARCRRRKKYELRRKKAANPGDV